VIELLIALGSTLSAPGAAPALQRPPVLQDLVAPSPLPSPQGYWICVKRGANGQCVVEKTCIVWEGGACQTWVYVGPAGSVTCLDEVGDACSALVERLGGSRPGKGPGGVSFWSGELRGGGGGPTGVSVSFIATAEGVLMVQGRAIECGPRQRDLLAALSRWASSAGPSRVAWSRSGCEMRVTHFDFDRWLRTPNQ
jgi:hypothetical protein